jgi:hypothetical protein
MCLRGEQRDKSAPSNSNRSYKISGGTSNLRNEMQVSRLHQQRVYCVEHKQVQSEKFLSFALTSFARDYFRKRKARSYGGRVVTHHHS